MVITTTELVSKLLQKLLRDFLPTLADDYFSQTATVSNEWATLEKKNGEEYNLNVQHILEGLFPVLIQSPHCHSKLCMTPYILSPDFLILKDKQLQWWCREVWSV